MVPSAATAYAVPGRRTSGRDGFRGSAAMPRLPRVVHRDRGPSVGPDAEAAVVRVGRRPRARVQHPTVVGAEDDRVRQGGQRDRSGSVPRPVRRVGVRATRELLGQLDIGDPPVRRPVVEVEHGGGRRGVVAQRHEHARAGRVDGHRGDEAAVEVPLPQHVCGVGVDGQHPVGVVGEHHHTPVGGGVCGQEPSQDPQPGDDVGLAGEQGEESAVGLRVGADPDRFDGGQEREVRVLTLSAVRRGAGRRPPCERPEPRRASGRPGTSTRRRGPPVRLPGRAASAACGSGAVPPRRAGRRPAALPRQPRGWRPGSRAPPPSAPRAAPGRPRSRPAAAHRATRWPDHDPQRPTRRRPRPAVAGRRVPTRPPPATPASAATRGTALRGRPRRVRPRP